MGTKNGCGQGDCGVCTILVNGEPLNSCLLLAVQADGKEITTIEGIGRNGTLDPLQKAFIKHGAVQCGYCTPGMILTSIAFLRKNANPSRDEIQKAISGNLCRCTGYVQIIDAIEEVAKSRKEELQ
jgi:aerobic carbon-monoxide dehydrogenase small subunit